MRLAVGLLWNSESVVWTTDGHWEKATQLTTARVANSGNISANPGKRSKPRNAKIPAIMAPDGAAISGISILVPPQGDEHVVNSLENPSHLAIRGSTGGSITNNQEISELLLLWSELDNSARRDLLAVARGWIKKFAR